MGAGALNILGNYSIYSATSTASAISFNFVLPLCVLMCDCVYTGGCQRTCHLCIQSLLSIFFEVGSLILRCISKPGWHTSFLGFSWLRLSSCIGELGLQRLSILRCCLTWVLWIQLGSSWLNASLLFTKTVFQTRILGGNGRLFHKDYSILPHC